MNFFVKGTNFLLVFLLYNPQIKMKIKNPFVAKNWTVGQAVLVVWVVFATAIVLINGWKSLNDVVFRNGMERGALLGQNNTITRVIDLSAGCNTVSLFAGEGENRVEVGLVDSQCSAAQVKAALDAAKAKAVIAEDVVVEEAAEEVDAE